MKVRGDLNPGEYSYNTLPKKPGWIEARLYENVEEAEPEEEEIEGGGKARNTALGYQYDEYIVEFRETANPKEYIERNREALLAAAKAAEAPKAAAPETANSDSVAERLNAIEDALCELDLKQTEGGE